MPLIGFLKYLLVATVLLTSCAMDKKMFLEGKLIYTVRGGELGSISFTGSGNKHSIIYTSKELSTINALTSVSGNTLLFDECVNGACALKSYSIENGRATHLRTGRLPTYISKYGKLFFYDESYDGSHLLFSSSLDDINDTTIIAEEPKAKLLPNGISQTITSPVVSKSNHEIIFIGKDENLWEYDFVNAKLLPMNIDGCRPIAWRDELNQLLCSDLNTWELFLLNMQDMSKEDIPVLKGAYGFVYVPTNDILIYGKTRSRALISETYDIFAYSFSNKKEIIIKKDSHIAGGIWLDN